MFNFSRSLPEETGISSNAIKDLILFLNKKEIPMHALLIMRKDKLVFEKYYSPYTHGTLHRMFSISKSFTAFAISILINEGKIQMDAPVTDYFPEYVNENTHPYIRQTTIRNMLMMRTCHASTTYKVDMKSDWVESFFTVPPTHKPGTVFHYDTSAAHVLCALVEKIAGMPMLDFLKLKFLNHLDFSQDSYMVKDPFGISMGGSGLMATPMDILKVLYVLDKKGTVTCSDGQTRTLLNPEFIKMATSNLSDSCMTAPVPSEAMGYGMQIWQNAAGGYVMYGMGGQLAISIPDKELLIMTCADTQGINGGNEVIYNGIYDILLPGISDRADDRSLQDSQKDYSDLLNVADSLSISAPRIPQMCSEVPVPMYDSISLKYKLDDNRQGFSHLQLDLDSKGKCSLYLSPSYTIHFGIGHMEEGIFPVYNNPYTAGAVWLRNNVLYLKVHLIGECVGSVRFQFYFEKDEVTVFMKKIEETYFREFDGHLHGILESQ